MSNGPAEISTPTKIEPSVPEVIPLEIRTNGGIRTATIDCPFCGCRHSHGWPPGDTRPGSRVPHCATTNKKASYHILGPDA